MGRIADFFDRKHIERLNAMDIAIKRRLTESAYSGRRKSGAKGSSQEFSDFREYAAGDDIRLIDWNSFARTDRLFVKLFMEEKQADVNFFIDISSSMSDNYGKGFYSAVLVCSLAYIALKNTDRINLFAFNDKICYKKIGVSASQRFFEAVSFVEGFSYGGGTDINAAVSESLKDIRGRGISYVVSDFCSNGGARQAIESLLYKKTDVCAVRIYSPEEENPSLKGNLRLIDSENGEYKDIEINSDIIKAYKKAYADEENSLREYCRKRGVKYVPVSSGSPVIKSLADVM